VILASRADPPLPLARLRARGELTEIRMSDLSLSASEAGQLITSVTRAELDASAVARLHERTEGWAAGIQLAALTIAGSSNPSAAVDTLSARTGICWTSSAPR
jgi:LuxR family maltose regulon positive regulatory protein